MSPKNPSVLKTSKKSCPSGIGRGVGNDEVDIEIDITPVQQSAAGQPQIDAVVEHLIAAIRPAVVVDRPNIALVEVRGREEEPMVVDPHGALNLAEIAAAL